MKILLCHNYYQHRGGEDVTFEAEARLLEWHGHRVVRFTMHNDSINGTSQWHLARQTLWNRECYRRLRALIRRQRPEVLHCTNIFPLISPAAYDAARHEGIPVVQSLHNYRLLCANALLLRDGAVCEECLHRRVPWPGIWHACYRNSRPASTLVTAMQLLHRWRRTWRRAVDRYIVLSDFSRRKFVRHGLPESKVAVKPNFVHPDPAAGDGQGGYAVFVGRLAQEKGIDTLLAAWRLLPSELPLRIIGDGPLSDRVARAVRQLPGAQWLGQLDPQQALASVGGAEFLVFPSCCYETFGRTIIEAFAKGTPVVASRLGAVRELVEEGRTGLLFEPGNASDLAATVRRLCADRPLLESMRCHARQEYLDKYTAEPNYRTLMTIYRQVLQSNGRSRSRDRSSVD